MPVARPHRWQHLRMAGLDSRHRCVHHSLIHQLAALACRLLQSACPSQLTSTSAR